MTNRHARMTPEQFQQRYEPLENTGEFVYHIAAADDLEEIRANGLEPQEVKQTNPQEIGIIGFSMTLQFFQQQFDFDGPDPLPFDRRNSVYAWPVFSERVTRMEANSVALVLRLDEITHDMFLAEHRHMDDVILSSPAYVRTTASTDELEKDGARRFARWFFNNLEELTAYHESACAVHTPTDVADVVDDHEEAELVINGTIDPAAIETVIYPPENQ